MMKKIITLLLTLVFILNTTYVHAYEKNINSTKTYLGNDIYVETVIEEYTTYATNTKTGKKTDTYTNSSGTKIYSLSVTGTFTYNRSSATCTSSSVATTVDAYDWKLIIKNASKSGNKAMANAIFSQYLNGNLIESRYPTITLTCSATGVLS